MHAHHSWKIAADALQKSETHIYLVMEYCTRSDQCIYISNRGKVPTLDFTPRPSMFIDFAPKSESTGKIFWPHPTTGGIDERVTRSFLGQLGACSLAALPSVETEWVCYWMHGS